MGFEATRQINLENGKYNAEYGRCVDCGTLEQRHVDVNPLLIEGIYYCKRDFYERFGETIEMHPIAAPIQARIFKY